MPKKTPTTARARPRSARLGGPKAGLTSRQEHVGETRDLCLYARERSTSRPEMLDFSKTKDRTILDSCPVASDFGPPPSDNATNMWSIGVKRMLTISLCHIPPFEGPRMTRAVPGNRAHGGGRRDVRRRCRPVAALAHVREYCAAPCPTLRRRRRAGGGLACGWGSRVAVIETICWSTPVVFIRRGQL